MFIKKSYFSLLVQIIVGLFLIGVAKASEVGPEISYGPEVVELKTSCEKLEKHIQSLKAWRDHLGEGSQNINIDFQKEGEKCKANVFPLLPKRAQSLSLTKPAHDGPNCWNTALNASNLTFTETSRHTAPGEILLMTRSKHCRKLDPTEALQPGDIVTIRGYAVHETKETHAYVYVNEELAFSKMNVAGYAGYTPELASVPRLGLVADDLATFPVHRHCANGKAKGCRDWHENYRCNSPMNEFKQAISEDQEMSEFYAKLVEVETELSERVMVESSLEGLDEVKAQLDVLDEQVTEHMAVNRCVNTVDPNEKNKFKRFTTLRQGPRDVSEVNILIMSRYPKLANPDESIYLEGKELVWANLKQKLMSLKAHSRLLTTSITGKKGLRPLPIYRSHRPGDMKCSLKN